MTGNQQLSNYIPTCSVSIKCFFFFCVTLGLHIFLSPMKSNLLDFLVDDFYLYEAEEVGTFIINVLK